MTGDEKRKLEPPLRLDLDFGEALERFVQTKPKEVAESVERSKTKRPPQDEFPRRPERASAHQETVSGRNRKP